ncbi:hypothetical protein D3C71_2226040 [compost metagenome]
MRQHRMEVDGAMRHRAVQIERDREDRQLGDDQEIDEQLDPTGLEDAAGKEIEQG